MGFGTTWLRRSVFLNMLKTAFTSATAKLVNIATNFAAILTFTFTGHIWWRVGLILAIANISGSILGARLAIRGGSPLVRKVFLVMTFLLIAKVGYDWATAS